MRRRELRTAAKWRRKAVNHPSTKAARKAIRRHILRIALVCRSGPSLENVRIFMTRLALRQNTQDNEKGRLFSEAPPLRLLHPARTLPPTAYLIAALCGLK